MSIKFDHHNKKDKYSIYFLLTYLFTDILLSDSYRFYMIIISILLAVIGIFCMFSLNDKIEFFKNNSTDDFIIMLISFSLCYMIN